MKLNNSYVLIDRGDVSKTDDWKKSHTAIDDAIKKMAWPTGTTNGLVISRIVSVNNGSGYVDLEGDSKTWDKPKPLTLRNGVVPLKQIFRSNLEASGWKVEEPLSLAAYFEKIRADKNLKQISRYPPPAKDAIHDPLHEGVGDFDFWLRSDTDFTTVVEWETGNISSSHRSLNKMCLALMAGLVDAAVLVVPSSMLCVHLTDRIGNIKELQPYFYFWNAFEQSINRGLLVIVEVEQDGLIKSTDMRTFIPAGKDGNAKKD